MGNVEIPKWLKGLPLAPEFRPTDTEFADPIGYISKIEKEASAFGICKIIPPLPKPSKKYVFSNLNKSLLKCPELVGDVNLLNFCSSSKVSAGDGVNDMVARAVFTTRQQELGHGVKRMKGIVKENLQLSANRQVWQSGEIYTLEQFESKSKAFARGILGMLKEVNPLVVETVFWKAASEKPIYIEYANDVPGSGFGEPEGQFRYFHKRRRKRKSYQSYRRSRESSDNKKDEMDAVNSFDNNETKAASVDIDPSIPLDETSRSSATSATSFSEESLKFSKRKSVNGNDMEGTAGWKLSNSPWNLQVIARSPGSLTRYMPDDIPGVTSPMVYIGMLFSWFAWHVEDHELHSLNFLHTGSPKTWYAIPGDYAFTFEEVIRSEAYGGNIDRLAALSLLGEKTTLLSPEMVVSSGIPCCRLIQNPGEFVVTFPRAYHVGFSHGFNCGEAANFGTPQWLKVAKEAAVRRAAMNYLPMLSHQQLLYLLTMSFASRVPRALLPGARSSRLRDRQREERELSVKKAFIEDLLKENDLLSTLLRKDSTCRVVVWNPDLLPCASKHSQLSSVTTEVDTIPRENVTETHPECDQESSENNLYKEMSLYMETVNDLYVNDDDDLSCDFQVDSGPLACVACGILGFPFMTVMQPSEKGSVEFLPFDNVLAYEGPEVERSENSCLPADPESTCKGSISVDLPAVPDLTLPLKDFPMPRGWSTYNKFTRPRIFCLEHGVLIQKLLEPKGGVNMLIICHSDYQKMKAHASVIAEEINVPFNYYEAQMESASQEDLNLIDLAIDNEDHVECGEDWTSKLGFNLRYCVKVGKNSPSKQVHRALVLGGLFCELFCEKNPSSDLSKMKWKSRRSRSGNKLNQPGHSHTCDDVETNKDEAVRKNSDNAIVIKEERLIHYTRRKFKVKIDCSAGGLQVGRHEKNDKHPVEVSESTTSGNLTLKSLPSKGKGSSLTTVVIAESIVDPIENQPLEESNKEENACDAVACNSSNDMNATCNTSPKEQGDVLVDRDFTMEISGKIDDVAANISCARNEECDQVTLGNEMHEEQLTSGKSNEDQQITCNNVQINESSEESSKHLLEACTAGYVLQEEDKIMTGRDEGEDISSNVGLTSQATLTLPDESLAITKDSCSVAKLCNNKASECDKEEKIQTADDTKEEIASFSVVQMEMDLSVSASGVSTVLGKTTSVEEGCMRSIMDAEMLPELPTTDKSNVVEGLPSVTIVQEGQIHGVSDEKCSEVPVGSFGSEDLSSGVLLGKESHKDIHLSNHSSRNDELHKMSQAAVAANEAEPLSSHVQINQPTADPIDDSCRAKEEFSVEKSMHKDNKKPSSNKSGSTVVDTKTASVKNRKRKNEVEQVTEINVTRNSFIRSPCEGLRPRPAKDTSRCAVDITESAEGNPATKRAKRQSDSTRPKRKEQTRRAHKCDLEGCNMSFETKGELQLHKGNRCPYEGCGKRFSSHKYAIVHQRVHEDDRPLKCPWKGCTMSFKWTWARTEHIRVHTGERPYQCKVEGCGLLFRFVSDFSRHRRKTRHYVNSFSDS